MNGPETGQEQGHGRERARCRSELAVRESERVRVRQLGGPLRLPREVAPVGEPAEAPVSEARAEGRRRRRWLWWVAAPVLALGTAVALVTVAPWRERGFDRPETQVRGEQRFGFYVNRGGTVWQGRPGELVAPGDSLRFVFWPRRATYAAVFGRDGGGHVSVYFPAAAQAQALRAGDETMAAGAVVLDASVGSETLYAVFCDGPFAVDPLRASISSGGLWSPPPGCEFETLTIEKRAS